MRTVIVGGARTPFGKFGGHLASLTAMELGGIAIKEAILRSGIESSWIDEVIIGHVLQAGQGQITSRQAAKEAGLAWDVTTETINKVCASGLRALSLADQIIRSGDEQVIVAGGMESMSHAPYLNKAMRWGAKMGDIKMHDSMLTDGLTCAFTGVHMGCYGNETANKFNITREAQDEWALRSHSLAIKAQEQGHFAEEIVPVLIKNRKDDSVWVKADEAPRADTSLTKLGQLKPAFGANGSITAGNAPGVNDGACAMVAMSEDKAKQLGIQPIATIIAHASVAVEASDFPETPGLVIQQLLKKANMNVADIDLFEINEAFAAVALTTQKLVDIDENKINVNGGAIALGHPIGASGARIVLTLIHELKRRGGGYGIASICSGGGQGDAILLKV